MGKKCGGGGKKGGGSKCKSSSSRGASKCKTSSSHSRPKPCAGVSRGRSGPARKAHGVKRSLLSSARSSRRRRFGVARSRSHNLSRRRFASRSHAWRRRHIIVQKPRKFDITTKVVLQKAVFLPGEAVQGAVIVRCAHTAGVPMRALRVRFTGKEHARTGERQATSVFIDQCVTIFGVPQTEVDAYRRSREERTRAALDRLARGDPAAGGELQRIEAEDETAILCAAGPGRGVTLVQPGEYSYPFTFQLPPAPTIPASCAADDDTDKSAEVVYQVKGILEVVDDFDAFDAAYLDVVVPMPQQQYAQEAAPGCFAPVPVTAVDKRSFCCFDRGEVGMTLRILKTLHVADRESVSVDVLLDATSCKEDVDGFTVYLSRRVSILSATGDVEARIVSTISRSSSAHGVNKGQTAAYNIQLPLKPSLAPTATLFHSRWEYHIWGILDGGSASASIPIRIAQTVLEVPQGWQSYFPPLSFDGAPQTRRLFMRVKNADGASCPRPPPQEFAYCPPPQSAFTMQPIPFGQPLPPQSFGNPNPQFGGGGSVFGQPHASDSPGYLHVPSADPYAQQPCPVEMAPMPAPVPLFQPPPMNWSAPVPPSFPTIPSDVLKAFEQPQAPVAEEDEDDDEEDDGSDFSNAGAFLVPM